MEVIVDKEKRRAERQNFETDIEFIVNDDILRASAVNISETGIRFNTRQPMCIEMRFMIDGKAIDKKARLCWAKEQQDGTFSYGLEYLNE